MRGRLWFLWNKLTREFGFLKVSWQRVVRLFLIVMMVGGIIIGFGAPQVTHADQKADDIKAACAVLKGHPNFPTADEQCVTDAGKQCSVKLGPDFINCVNAEVASVKAILDNHPHTESCADASFFSGTNFKCMILDVIQFILGKIVWALGKVLTFLIEIFLGFAQYNGFSDAPPVLMGWKLIRDLVNMFFIVILLVSAFATIIGYGGEDFHAAHVLPKLLLMAVLINFSKTLIQLLIDFSQVIMLTFVNAFQTTASAQLVDAFGLTIVTKEAQGGGVADLMNFIVSYLLGIVVLIIAIGVMVILIGYIIGRIIGLWMALIFSPLALFATAIPSKLQKGMGNLTSEYWGKLTGFLTGGPIIAFYLWLTMAILQGASAGGEELSKSLKLYNPTGAVDQSGFFTQLGQSVSIAKFIIAISLLMMAMKAAVEAAGTVSSSMGEFAQKVQGYTRSAAGTALAPIRFAAASPFLAARTGLRGVKAGAAAAERRWDFRGKVGRLGQATVGRMPGLRGVLRAPLAGATTAGKAQREKEAADLLKPTAGMDHAQKLQFASSLPTGRTASPAERQAHASIMQDLASDKSQLGETKKLAAQYETAGMSKDGAMSRARAEVAATSAGHLATAKEAYKKLDMMDKVKEIDDQIEKNPFLEKDPTKRADLFNKVRLDPEKIKALSPDAISRGEVLSGLLPATAIKRDAAGNVTGFDQAQIDLFMAQNKDTQLGKNMQAMLTYVRKTRGTVPPGTVSQEDINDMLLQKGKQGEVKLYKGATGGSMRNGQEIAADNKIETLIRTDPTFGRDAATGQMTAPANKAVLDTLQAGKSLSEVLVQTGVPDGSGGFVSDGKVEAGLGTRLAYGMKQVKDATTKIDLDAAFKDIPVLAKNLEGEGITSEAQNQMLSSLDLVGAAEAYDHDKWKMTDNNQKESLTQIIKVAAARAREISAKIAGGGTATPQEQRVLKFIDKVKLKQPSVRIKRGPGFDDIPQASHGLYEHLHAGPKTV